MRRWPAATRAGTIAPWRSAAPAGSSAELLEVLADPAHPEHADRLAWLGRTFDPAAFDLQAIAAVLARLRIHPRR